MSADKALAACREYVRVADLIRSLTGKIGDALTKCPGNGEFDSDVDGDAMPRTHLRAYYRQYDRVRDTAEFRACPYCVAADKLIQERKAARQTWGAAKRQITKIGKAKP